MEACASVEEAQAFSDKVTASASQAGRDPKSVEKIARLNACVAENGQAARAVVRPLVARYLGAGRLRSRTLEAQGLALRAQAQERLLRCLTPRVLPRIYRYWPLITDCHVDALTLAGTIEEVPDHVVALTRAGIDGIIIRPFAPEGGTIEDTIVSFGSKVWQWVASPLREREVLFLPKHHEGPGRANAAGRESRGMPRRRQNDAYQRCRAAYRRLRAPLARDESDLPLPKPIERAILASDPTRDLANVG
jgi:hypothetical protein